MTIKEAVTQIFNLTQTPSEDALEEAVCAVNFACESLEQKKLKLGDIEIEYAYQAGDYSVPFSNLSESLSVNSIEAVRTVYNHVAYVGNGSFSSFQSLGDVFLNGGEIWLSFLLPTFSASTIFTAFTGSSSSLRPFWEVYLTDVVELDGGARNIGDEPSYCWTTSPQLLVGVANFVRIRVTAEGVVSITVNGVEAELDTTESYPIDFTSVTYSSFSFVSGGSCVTGRPVMLPSLHSDEEFDTWVKSGASPDDDLLWGMLWDGTLTVPVSYSGIEMHPDDYSGLGTFLGEGSNSVIRLVNYYALQAANRKQEASYNDSIDPQESLNLVSKSGFYAYCLGTEFSLFPTPTTSKTLKLTVRQKLSYFIYTEDDYATADGEVTNYLLTYFPSLVLARALVYFAVYQHDKSLYEINKLDYDLQLAEVMEWNSSLYNDNLELN